MTLSPGPTDLTERYGRSGRGQRLVVTVVVGAIAIAGLVWLGWAAYLNATPGVSGTLTAYDVRGPHLVVARVVVQTHGSHHGTCDLQALAEDHSLVGERLVTVAAGTGAASRQYALRTERTATTVEVARCTTLG